MTDFFVGKAGRPGSLRRRRLMDALRRMMVAVCVGLAVFAALACVTGSVATRTVVIAAADIARGTAVDGSMLRLARMPAGDGSALRGAWASLEDLPGHGIAQVDIVAGQPVYGPMIRDQPTIPNGFTVIEVRLASDADALMAGDEIALASAAGCDDADKDEDSGRTDGDDASHPSCVLVERALVMGQSPKASAAGYATDATTALAMPPEDALRVMSSQEAGAIIAVAQ